MLSFAAMVQGMTFQLIPKWACILVFIVLMLTLEVLGGMNSVVLTDVVQSTVMILSFLAVPFFLAFEYGSLPDMGPADCPFLMSVSPNVTDSFSVPEQCMGSGCVAAGCIAAVKPEFYEFPSRSTLCDVIFFLINMLAARALNLSHSHSFGYGSVSLRYLVFLRVSRETKRNTTIWEFTKKRRTHMSKRFATDFRRHCSRTWCSAPTSPPAMQACAW